MVIEACRAVLTERCRLMCKQRGRQQPSANRGDRSRRHPTASRASVWRVLVWIRPGGQAPNLTPYTPE
jgi:hypothetical protein